MTTCPAGQKKGNAMKTTDTSEGGLESLIVRHLVEVNGYEQGANADYNREYAIDETKTNY